MPLFPISSSRLSSKGGELALFPHPISLPKLDFWGISFPLRKIPHLRQASYSSFLDCLIFPYFGVPTLKTCQEYRGQGQDVGHEL